MKSRRKSGPPEAEEEARPGVFSGYRRIILHCGLHKTGTSYLQTVLHENIPTLAKYGLEFPTTFRDNVLGNEGNHGLAARKYMECGDVDTAFREATDIGQRHPKLLLSGEGFSKYLRQNGFLEAFMEATYGAEVRFVFYLRRPDHFYESAYAQTVRKVISGDIRQTTFRYDFYERIMPFVEAVGKENITVRPYNRRLWPDGELGSDFCTAIGEPGLWERIRPDSGTVVNASLNRNQIFLLSRIKTIVAKKKLQQYFAENPALPDDGVRYFLSPQERRGINARFAEANQRLADTLDLGDMNHFLGDMNHFLGIEEDGEEEPGWRPYEPDWEMLFCYLANFTDYERRK